MTPKMERSTAYKTSETYVAPLGSLVALDDGELIMTFREAARSRLRSHVDARSWASMIRSSDKGNTWSASELIYDDPDGIQDPCIMQTASGSLLVTFFKWSVATEEELPDTPPPGRLTRTGWNGRNSAWTKGTFLVRSEDRGRTWSEDAVEVQSPLGSATLTSDPILQLDSGDLLMPLYGKRSAAETDVVAVLRSSDDGTSWGDFSIAAFDPLGNDAFLEPSLAQTPSGGIICMARAHHVLDPAKGSDSGTPEYLFRVFSEDGGKTWHDLGRTPMWGHPPHVILLADGRLLCAYGYRRAPYGVRVCLSEDGGTSWNMGDEIPLYTHGAGFDLGYPCSVQLPDRSILTAWYESSQTGVSEIHTVRYRV